jgi:hypothetical protein
MKWSLPALAALMISVGDRSTEYLIRRGAGRRHCEAKADLTAMKQDELRPGKCCREPHGHLHPDLRRSGCH